MSDASISLLILAASVVLFVWNRLPVEWVAIASALALYFTGVLDLQQALAGFGDPAVILIAALFVVSEGLDATGVTARVGQALVNRSGDSTRRLLILTMLLSAGLTALIGLNGAVAALLPMAVVMAVRRAFPPSRLLMPLAFAGSAGGMLLLTGSPVNVVIAEAAAEAGVGAFSFAEFAWAGVPLVAGTLVIVLLFGERLLPVRHSAALPPDFSGHARTLVEHYGLDDVFHIRVPAGSKILGRQRDDWADLAARGDVRVITVLDGEIRRPVSDGPVSVGDRITIVGDPAAIDRYAAEYGLTVEAVRTAADVESSLLARSNGAAEVVIPPRSRFVGTAVRPGRVIDGTLIVLAVQRQGRDCGSRSVDLQVGDVLLVEGDWAALEERSDDQDVLVVDSPAAVRRQTVPMAAGSTPAVVILIAMVIMLATGVVPPVLAAMLAAGAMILFRVVSVQQAYHGVAWSTVLMVAGMIPMSTAITQSGAGELVADRLVGAIGDAGPTVLLIALFVLTIAFGQLISNTATALVVIPIALSAAGQLGVSARPVLMCVCVAAAASFLTPVATPANMMVLGPGGYRFGDYWKLGLPLVALFFAVAVFLVPVVWPF